MINKTLNDLVTWICNDDNANIFDGITTLIMILLAVVAVITAIVIAHRQRKMLEHDYVNNLAFELAVDFICPFNEYADRVGNFLNATQGISDNADIISRLFEILDEVSLRTDFRYWEMHKGDINDALEKNNNEPQISQINAFILAARKHKSDVSNIRKQMREYLCGQNEQNPISEMASSSRTEYSFYAQINERGRRIIDDMKNSINDLPEELKIEDTCKKVKMQKRK